MMGQAGGDSNYLRCIDFGNVLFKINGKQSVFHQALYSDKTIVHILYRWFSYNSNYWSKTVYTMTMAGQTCKIVVFWQKTFF